MNSGIYSGVRLYVDLHGHDAAVIDSIDEEYIDLIKSGDTSLLDISYRYSAYADGDNDQIIAEFSNDYDGESFTIWFTVTDQLKQCIGDSIRANLAHTAAHYKKSLQHDPNAIKTFNYPNSVNAPF